MDKNVVLVRGMLIVNDEKPLPVVGISKTNMMEIAGLITKDLGKCGDVFDSTGVYQGTANANGTFNVR